MHYSGANWEDGNPQPEYQPQPEYRPQPAYQDEFDAIAGLRPAAFAPQVNADDGLNNPTIPYGNPTPPFNNSAAQYGSPPVQYGAPPVQYGAPPARYGNPPARYGNPPAQYGNPPAQYGARASRRSAQASAPNGPSDPVSRLGMTVAVNPTRIGPLLWLVTGALVVLDWIVSVGSAEHLLPYVITRFFDGDDKINFPTGEKTTLLLGCTLLMAACWATARRAGSPAARGWLLLSLVTAFAFVDETTFLHQSLSMALQDTFHFHGVLKYAWTVVYFPAAVVVGMFLMRNAGQLRPAIRVRLLTAGAIYAAGAMLFEPVKSHIADNQGDGSLAFKVAAAASDCTELVGLTLLALVMLAAISWEAGTFSFSLPRPE